MNVLLSGGIFSAPRIGYSRRIQRRPFKSYHKPNHDHTSVETYLDRQLTMRYRC
jgi:hypothetical protein